MKSILIKSEVFLGDLYDMFDDEIPRPSMQSNGALPGP